LPSPQQKEVLSTERVKSTIPKVSNMLSIRWSGISTVLYA
jgi:hypothetical protein